MDKEKREELGKVVRKVWIGFCEEIGDDKPSHIAPWEELSENDKEVDRRIGEKLYTMGMHDAIDSDSKFKKM